MTATPEQIEAVARAICSEKGDNWEARNFNETGDGTEPEENREAYRHIALAAINAMRPFIRAEVLEEAAKVAKAYEHPNMALYNHQTGIAANIRALKEKP